MSLNKAVLHKSDNSNLEKMFFYVFFVQEGAFKNENVRV